MMRDTYNLLRHLGEEMPAQAVKVVVVCKGKANVLHLASGIILGTVERDGDGRGSEWKITLGDGVALRWSRENRAKAVEEVLDPRHHHPGIAYLDRPGHEERMLTEEESRRAFPETWAWWDRVRPLFPPSPPAEKVEPGRFPGRL